MQALELVSAYCTVSYVQTLTLIMNSVLGITCMSIHFIINWIVRYNSCIWLIYYSTVSSSASVSSSAFFTIVTKAISASCYISIHSCDTSIHYCHGDFLDESLHLHWTNWSKLCGAASLSVMTGVNTWPISFHHHCSESKLITVRLDHNKTCKWTCRLWKWAALSVGGSFYCLSSPLHEDTIAMNLAKA